MTHSLLLLPLWAWLLALGFSRFGGGRLPWQAYYGVCALAIGIHILGDLITSYGTQILAPFSNWAPGFNATFIIDPWFSVLLLGGFLLSLRWRPRQTAAASLALITVVVLFQYGQYRSALAVGEAHAAAEGIQADRIEAYPQPLSWFNWKVIITADERYYTSRFNLRLREPRAEPAAEAGLMRTLYAAYPPVDDARWRRERMFGDGTQDAAARAVWAQEDMAFYHWFADAPLVHDVERIDGDQCVWFHDLRFQIPSMEPPFRYGMCRSGLDDWRAYWRRDRVER